MIFLNIKCQLHGLRNPLAVAIGVGHLQLQMIQGQSVSLSQLPVRTKKPL